MMRISAASEREPVRISRKALEQGLSFEKVGRSFSKGYHTHPKAAAVKLIFVTAADFPYEQLANLAHQGEQITKSMNHIFNNLVMDCSSCNLKPVCDEVEGLREAAPGSIDEIKTWSGGKLIVFNFHPFFSCVDELWYETHRHFLRILKYVAYILTE